MTIRQSFDQTVFLMSGLYGSLSNKDLKEAMEKDVNAAMEMDLVERFVFFQRYYQAFVNLFKKVIKFDKFRNTVDHVSGDTVDKFKIELPEIHKKNLTLARLSVRLITDLKKIKSRSIYTQQLWFIMWTIDKYEEYNTPHD